MLNRSGKIFLIVAFLALATLVFTKFRKTNAPKPLISENSKQNQELPSRFSVENSKIPKNFPVDLPGSAKATEVVQNEEVVVMGKNQSRRQFIYPEDLSKSYEIYKTYMKEKGWVLVSEVDEPTFKSLIGTRQGKSLSISLSIDEKTKKTLVNSSVEY